MAVAWLRHSRTSTIATAIPATNMTDRTITNASLGFFELRGKFSLSRSRGSSLLNSHWRIADKAWCRQAVSTSACPVGIHRLRLGRGRDVASFGVDRRNPVLSRVSAPPCAAFTHHNLSLYEFTGWSALSPANQSGR